VLGAALLAVSPAAGAPEAPKANSAADPAQITYRCVQSFDAGQKLRATSRLLAARAEFRECAQDACPELTSKPCSGWLSELELLVPTASIIVTAIDGSALPEARATLDGLAVGEVDGAPLELDPGQHRIKVEVPGFEAQERTFQIEAGTHELPLRFRFGSLAPLGAGQSGEQGTSALAVVGWTGVALAAAGVVVGAVTGGLAMSNKAQLEDDCGAGQCTQDDIDGGRVPAKVSTAGFIVGGVGALVGIICLAVDLSGDEPATESSARAELLLGPGTLTWRASFQ
jgi:hypothetical protein